MAKKAVLFGATGLVGSFLLSGLLNSDDYDNVTIVVRKNTAITHPKLITLIGNYNILSGLKNKLVCNDLFIALGTTKKNTPDQEQYYQVDHDYPLLAGRIARDNGARSVFIVSSVGADTHSRIFYTRTKGETEHDIIALGFPHTNIFRPSMILGQRNESRPLEKLLIRIWPVIDPLLVGRWNRFRGTTAADIAAAMIKAAGQLQEKIKIYEWKEMHDLLAS